MSGYAKKMEDGNWHISSKDYTKTHRDYKGKWTNPSWPEAIGKRSLMVYDNGTCLVVEGFGLVIDKSPREKKSNESRI